MKYLITILSFISFSCNEKSINESANFNEQIVDFAINYSENKFIELPNLYDSLSKEIAEKDEDEKLILVQILKEKGFEITNWGRGNHPLGPRMIVLNLKKSNCECEVRKIYYATNNLNGSIYKTTESIKCYKVNQ